ncbi:MAG: type II secretion system protein [Candidatus Pacebacteria bacterium]|nr:type II secretion system protein [Candidatus Paceibacterota bacterium]
MSIHKQRGFTLIELLVVIAIIGMLSSVVLASLNSAREKSRDARRLSDIRQIQTALELAFDSTSPVEYPNALSTLVSLNYLPSEPKDPRTDVAYYYANLTNAGAGCVGGAGNACTNYVLGANLENSSHGALASDIDTDFLSVSGPNCVDPVYCVQP